MASGNNHNYHGWDDFGRYDDTTSRFPKMETHNNFPQEPPPSYYSAAWRPTLLASSSPRSRWDPRVWNVRKRLLAFAAIIILVVVIIVGAYEGALANRYPNYSRLNYSLAETYEGAGFFDKFQYYSSEDPTYGFVHYLDAAGAAWSNLTFATDTTAIIKVDSTTPNTLTGRNSIRVESKRTYDSGLFIFDILHSPVGCGTWPALWLADAYNWPTNGEIDVLEATNTGTQGNAITLHTTDGCTMNVKRKQDGRALGTDCYNNTDNNAGCSVQGQTSTYGPDFNTIGGGIYAAELRAAGIRIWFFPRSSIPADISDPNTNPDPSTWGTALADFPSTKCDVTSHFRNQSIIANIDLCGEYAGQSQFYNGESDCPGTCSDFVAHNPAAFGNAYWEFKSFKVYQAG